MPRVPVAEARQRSEPLGLQPQHTVASPELLSNGRQVSALGGALGDAAGAAFDIAERKKQRDDADAVFKHEASLRAQYIQFESDTKRSRKADQAKGVTQDVDTWWQQQSDKTLGEVTDQRQRRLLTQSITRMRLQSLDSFRGYEDNQAEVAHDANWKASKATLISQAAADPKLAPDAIKQLQQKNSYYAAVRGLSAEVKDALDMEDTTRVHSEIIKQMVQVDPTRAKDYFEANKKQIAGTSYDEITKLVNHASAANDGEKAADAVWKESGPKGYNDPVMLDKLEDAVRTKYPDDRERQKAGIAALRERAVAHNAAQAETKADNTNRVLAIYQSTRSLAAAQKTPAWSQLSAADQLKIEDYVRGQQASILNLSNQASQRELLNQERDQRRLKLQGFAAYAAYSDPEVLAKMSDQQVQALLPSLGNELTEHLLTKRRALTTRDAIGDAKIDNDDFNAIASRMGLRPHEKHQSEEQKAKLNELRYRVETIVDKAQRDSKAKLTREQKQEIMQREVSRTVSVPGWFWTATEKPVITLSQDELKKVVVPADARKQIVEGMAQAYKLRGGKEFEPTEENIRRWYARSVSPEGGKLIPEAANAR